MNSLKLNKEWLQNFNEFINKKVDEENKIIEFLQSQIGKLILVYFIRSTSKERTRTRSDKWNRGK